MTFRTITDSKSLSLTLALLASIAFTNTADANSEEGLGSKLSNAVSDGTVGLSARYRYEHVDQDGIDEDAGASTLKARLSFKSGSVGGWSFGTEADYVAIVGDENYNSTVNGNTEYPVVADPEGFDLNAAFIQYSGEGYSATVGRQRIVQDGQRFIGGVAWRQNEQTYDALRGKFAINEKLSLDYSYVWNVNRIFGPDDGAQPSDWRSNSHFLHAAFKANANQALTGFVYLLDFENDNGLPNSTSTVGLRYNGKFGPLSIEASVATQSDYADSPLSYDANYYFIEGAYKAGPATLKVGHEVLGSDDGVAAFRTPLATLHKFQGWADKFLGTPATGIEDSYVSAAGKFGKVAVALTYHQFKANEGGLDYGDEINAVATLPISKRLSAQLKLADYSADELATDTTKIWLTLNAKI